MDRLTLANICQGAVDERFARELGAVLDNIGDPNTPVDKPRELTLKFKFFPFSDRAGAQVTFEIGSKLAGMASLEGTVYLTVDRPTGEVVAYPRDPRQDSLFAEKAAGSGPQ
jgi:hypothetical protein